jgi:protease-4
MTGIILPRRNLNQGEEARFKEYILDLYGSFTAKVAASRGMDIERVESLAQGRVYSGLGAFNSGLIDGIGGLDDALRSARELAGIPEGKKVAYSEFPKPRFFDKMMERMFSKPVSAYAGASYAETTTAARAAAFVADIFLPAQMLEDLRFRIAHNGQVMPILPLDSGVLSK